MEWKLKESIYGYHGGEKSPFLKVTLKDPKNIAAAKRAIERGISFEGFSDFTAQTYESNLAYLLRFMIDCKVKGANWIELPSGTYKQREDRNSSAQINVEIRYGAASLSKGSVTPKRVPVLIFLSLFSHS